MNLILRCVYDITLLALFSSSILLGYQLHVFKLYTITILTPVKCPYRVFITNSTKAETSIIKVFATSVKDQLFNFATSIDCSKDPTCTCVRSLL